MCLPTFSFGRKRNPGYCHDCNNPFMCCVQDLLDLIKDCGNPKSLAIALRPACRALRHPVKVNRLGTSHVAHMTHVTCMQVGPVLVSILQHVSRCLPSSWDCTVPVCKW
jgi:hypothetical protein